MFAELENPADLMRRLDTAYIPWLTECQRVVSDTCSRWRGYAVDGHGDSYFYAFQRAGDAVGAVVALQRELAGVPWPAQAEFRLRCSLHTGEPVLVDDRYVGLDINRAARFCGAAHGGQVVLSQTSMELVKLDLPPGVTLRDLGQHRLKDLRRPWHLYQLVIDGLPSDFPPLNSLRNRPNNLPIPPTDLIGRETETQAIHNLLAQSECRLVTLLGPGGVGKTRLSLHVASEALDTFNDGVFFVNLAPIREPSLVLTAIAQTLDLREETGAPLLDTLARFLRTKQLLLVLDNVEQVIEAARSVADLLMASPTLKIITTSRVPLRIRGEREFPVTPLALPPVGDQVEMTAAIELFDQRAREVKSNFMLNDATLPSVAEICRRLDGLPLAIELAAARIRFLPPQALLARLSGVTGAMPLLTGGARDLPERHRTLRNAIEWSHDLLSEDERTLFRRLSVFIGGRTFEAIEAVCNAHAALTVDILEALTALVDGSLLRAETSTDETRFVMLETIHEFAQEKLETSGEAETLQRLHASYFMTLAEEAEPQLHRTEQKRWLQRLETEHHNLRAAMRWALAGGDPVLGGRLAGALWLFWYLRGHLREGRSWLEKSLVGDGLDDAYRGKALSGAGTLAWAMGDYEAARTHYEACLALYDAIGNQEGYGSALTNLGLIAYAQGDFPTARSIWERSLVIKKAVGHKGGYVGPLNNLGEVARHMGDYASARARFEESLDIYRELGNRWGVANSLVNLGQVAWCEGQPQEALTRFDEALHIFREVGNQTGLATTLDNLGLVHTSLAQYDQARLYYDESLTMRRDSGDKSGLATTLHGLGRLALAMGNLPAAREQLQASLSLRHEIGDKNGLAEGLEGLARLAGVEGRWSETVRLLGAAATLRKAIHAALPVYEQASVDQLLAEARAGFTAHDYADAWTTGQSLPLDEAVALALSISRPNRLV